MVSENITLILTNNSSDLLNNYLVLGATPTLDSAWIFSIIILLVSIYGILGESKRRNILYMLGIFEYSLILSILLLIYINIAHYSVSNTFCASLVVLLIPDVEYPLVTFSYLFSILIMAYFILNFKNNRLYQPTQFLDNLYGNFLKKNYAIVLTDLEAYLEELEGFYLSERYITFEEKFENFLNSVSDDEEFIYELGKCPDLAYKILNSNFNFNKTNFWNHYSKYLFLNKNSKLYKEIINIYPEDHFLYFEYNLEIRYEDIPFINFIFRRINDSGLGAISAVDQFLKEKEQKITQNMKSEITFHDSPIYVSLMFYDLKINYMANRYQTECPYSKICNLHIGDILDTIKKIILRIIDSMCRYQGESWYYDELEQYLELIFKICFKWISFSKENEDIRQELFHFIFESFYELMTAKLNSKTKHEIYDIIDELLEFINDEFNEETKNECFDILLYTLNSKSQTRNEKFDNLKSIKDILKLFGAEYNIIGLSDGEKNADKQ